MEKLSCNKRWVTGWSARTSNTSPDMQAVIGGLWAKLFTGPIPEGACTIGLYSDYENGVQGDYTITVGFESKPGDPVPQGMTQREIPAGEYVRLWASVKDCAQTAQAVAPLWQQIWSTPLERTYTGDYEEYLPEGDHWRVNVYAAVKNSPQEQRRDD